MNPYAYALMGLTAVVAVIVAIVTFAVLRFAAAARDTRRYAIQRGETALLSAALEEALGKLRAQERATAARAEASERLSTEIVASLASGLLVVALDGAVRILNPAGRRLLRVDENAPLASYRDMLGNASTLAAVIDECLRTGRAIVRRAVPLPEGSAATHLGVTVSPLADVGGLHGAICLFTDLTAVIDLEQQLRLKDALAQVGEMTAGIAHEFRNGLATIYGYARLMDPEAMPPSYRPYVEGIRDETDALGQVVTNFLNFARPQPVSLHDVDLEALVRRVAADVAADAEALGGEVSVSGTFAPIVGDDVLLRQVFQNLLRNALEACQRVSRPPRVLLEGHVESDQAAARVAVHDNGPGIEPSARARIFKPFYTTREGGTGLGLAIVQKIVVLHNGRITVAVSPRGGAVFQMTFPLADRS